MENDANDDGARIIYDCYNFMIGPSHDKATRIRKSKRKREWLRKKSDNPDCINHPSYRNCDEL